MPSVIFVTKMKILFIYETIVLSMITLGKLLAIVYNLTLHIDMLSEDILQKLKKC